MTDDWNDAVEACAVELVRLRELLHSQFEALDIARESHIYTICIDAIRALKRPNPTPAEPKRPGLVRSEEDRFLEFTAEDVTTITGAMMAMNVEPLYRLSDRKMIGYRVYDDAMFPAVKPSSSRPIMDDQSARHVETFEAGGCAPPVYAPKASFDAGYGRLSTGDEVELYLPGQPMRRGRLGEVLSDGEADFIAYDHSHSGTFKWRFFRKVEMVVSADTDYYATLRELRQRRAAEASPSSSGTEAMVEARHRLSVFAELLERKGLSNALVAAYSFATGDYDGAKAMFLGDLRAALGGSHD